jgi:hypothetical protein
MFIIGLPLILDLDRLEHPPEHPLARSSARWAVGATGLCSTKRWRPCRCCCCCCCCCSAWAAALPTARTIRGARRRRTARSTGIIRQSVSGAHRSHHDIGRHTMTTRRLCHQTTSTGGPPRSTRRSTRSSSATSATTSTTSPAARSSSILATRVSGSHTRLARRRCYDDGCV